MKFYYSDNNQDQRETILLLHGLGVNGDSWKFQINSLLDLSYRVITLDLEGFGKTEMQSDIISLARAVENIDDLAINLKIKSLNIIGISLGGIVGLLYAIKYPNKVKKLVVINSLAKVEKESFVKKLRTYTVIG